MGLYLTRTFQKTYLKLPNNIQDQVQKALEEIFLDPHSAKKLTGELEGEISYRIGNYRIFYCVDKKQNIWIETVGHRTDVYKKRSCAVP
jgi:mRNA-degrading endonuclease RelE of RelBE toxin-antitoxin system